MRGQSKQTNKRTSIDTHTLLQCSHASVGLAQAHPNNKYTHVCMCMKRSLGMYFAHFFSLPCYHPSSSLFLPFLPLPPSLPPSLPHNQNKNSEFCAPLTSFDWNETDPNILGASSIDTTCTIWGLEVRTCPIPSNSIHMVSTYHVAFVEGNFVKEGTIAGELC